jgi:hypothetical protein
MYSKPPAAAELFEGRRDLLLAAGLRGYRWPGAPDSKPPAGAEPFDGRHDLLLATGLRGTLRNDLRQSDLRLRGHHDRLKAVTTPETPHRPTQKFS